MLNPQKSGKWSLAVTAQEPHPVVRIDEIDGPGADVEDAEHTGLDAELPLAVEKCFVPVNGERFAEIGAKHSAQIQPLGELPVQPGKVWPAGIGMKGGEQRAVRKPFWPSGRDRRLYRIFGRWLL